MPAGAGPGAVTVLVIDDEAAVRDVLVRLLQGAGYRTVSAADLAEARNALKQHELAAIVCDVNLPDGSGVDLVREAVDQLPDLGVVMLTGVDDPDVAGEAFRLGAAAYVVKPFTGNEVLINVANCLRLRDLERSRRTVLEQIERTIVERGRSLQSAVRRVEDSDSHAVAGDRELVDRLAGALSLRHEETGRHIERVGYYSEILARAGGFAEWTPDAVRLAAMLHDVGKIGVPDSVLTKAGPLDDEETAQVRRHPELGHALLSGSRSPVIALGATAALTHHERWDGMGYPMGVAGDRIPLVGRIAAVADVFDAMCSYRSYHRPIPVPEVVAHIREQRGRHFDPDLVDLFDSVLDEFTDVLADHPDPEPAAAVRVLVVDDHQMFAQSVARLLAREPGILLVGVAGTVAQGLALADSEVPQVVLMDLELPDGDGLSATRSIRERHPETQVVMLTGRTDDAVLVDAIRAGCAGFLPKSEAFHRLSDLIHRAAEGRPAMPSSAVPRLLAAMQTESAPRRSSVLTQREVEVLELVAQGLGTDAIADRLRVSSLTARNHLQNAMSKMGAHTRLEAVVTAVRQGVVRVS